MYYRRDECPTTLTTAFHLLVRESSVFDKSAHRNWRFSHDVRGGGNYGVIFVQAGHRRKSDRASAGKGNGVSPERMILPTKK